MLLVLLNSSVAVLMQDASSHRPVGHGGSPDSPRFWRYGRLITWRLSNCLVIVMSACGEAVVKQLFESDS